MDTLKLEIKFKEITHLLFRIKINKLMTIDPKVVLNIELMKLFQILNLPMHHHNQPNQIALSSTMTDIQQETLINAIHNWKPHIRTHLQIITIQTQVL